MRGGGLVGARKPGIWLRTESTWLNAYKELCKTIRTECLSQRPSGRSKRGATVWFYYLTRIKWHTPPPLE
eukprot:11183915-Lingulodinium_polyedra.AAC.1